MKKTTLLMAILAAASLTTGHAQQAQNLLTNGSFELGDFVDTGFGYDRLLVGSTDMTGWTVVTNEIVWGGPTNVDGITAPDGQFFLDLTSYGAEDPIGGVTQTIITTPGATYHFSLVLFNPLDGASISVQIDAGSTSMFLSSSGGFDFTATSNNTPITITGMDGDHFVGIDNASVLDGKSACAIPTSLSTSNVTDTSATLSWDAVSGAVEYQINYKVVGAAQWIVVRSTNNSKTLGSLTPGTNYVWRVRTVCSKSPLVASAYSGQVQFTTTEETATTCDFATNLHTGESASPSGACDIPSNVTEVEILPTRAILRWDAVSGAIGYEIKYYEVYPDQGATIYVCTTRMRVTLENLNRNAAYRYSIRAICSEDPLIVSDYTPESEFRTPQRPR